MIMSFLSFYKDLLIEGAGKVVQKGVNQRGKQYAIVKLNANNKFVVYGMKSSYDSKMPNGLNTRWVMAEPRKDMKQREKQDYANNGVEWEEALQLFNKRISGKSR